MAEKGNMHSGHRERVRERYLKTGFDGFSDINILEMLLFYSIPRKDTNEIAHRLLDEFGSLSGVFDAPYEMLLKVKGVTANAAVEIKMITDLFQKYEEDKYSKPRTELSDAAQAGKYCVSKFLGKTVEHFYAIIVDDTNTVMQCILISTGVNNSTSINCRKIIEKAITLNASGIILTHNHPNGVAAPSSDDLQATVEVANALKNINVRLLDHIIVSGRDFISLKKSQKFNYIFK